MTEVARGTLKGKITPTGFVIEERDPRIIKLYGEYFKWLEKALKTLPESAFTLDSSESGRSRRLWTFAPGEGHHAREIAAEALNRAQRIAETAGLEEIPQRLNPPVFIDHVERVDINRYTTYSVRRYDQAALLTLIDQVLNDLQDPEVTWKGKPDSNQAIPKLRELRRQVERGDYGDTVVTRSPVNDVRALIYIHGKDRPERKSFNNGIFVEGHDDVPIIQRPADPGRIRRTRRDRRRDLPLFTIPTRSGPVAFYAAQVSQNREGKRSTAS